MKNSRFNLSALRRKINILNFVKYKNRNLPKISIVAFAAAFPPLLEAVHVTKKS